MESSQSIDLEIEEQNGNDGEKESTEEQDVNKGEADDEKGKVTTRAKRSMVWDHFTYVKGASSSKCPYCSQVLACHSKDNGTSGLKSHLELYCPKSPVLLRKKGDRKQATLGFKPVEKGAGGSLATHSFSVEKCKRALSRMCIKDNRPFSIVDDEGFKEYSWEMNPLFKLPSRWTVARECLRIYKEEAEIVKKLLKNQTVSLTTDTWSSIQNINYMCLTGHWVDDDWVLRKNFLNFCPIANHKGDTIGKDVNIIQTGRPFSPVVFEGVLKHFAPDVPSSISRNG